MAAAGRMIPTMRIETLAVHAGAEPDPVTGAVAPPIHLSTTFEHGPANEDLHGFIYVRDENPTQDRLEDALSLLEGGDEALVFASGMGASAALLQVLEPNSHVIFPEDVYVHVRVMHQQYLPKWGIQASVVDTQSPEAVERAVRPDTKLVWLETPSNPRLHITDIVAVSQIAHAAGALVVVDNTFATPVFQRPLELGADVVLHSMTKYYGGHSDVQGGCLILQRRAPLYDRLFHIRMTLGAVCSPFNAWLVLRGLRTLPCRMARHAANALAVAAALGDSRAVEPGVYSGLTSHPGHDVAQRQIAGFGGEIGRASWRGREEISVGAVSIKKK